MRNNRKVRGFTLIELIAVLVIMAIIALIATPLVINIIRKARISADKRSIDAYGRSIELAVASYLLDTGKFPTQISDLTIEYSGNEVVCSTTRLNSDSSVYLTGCTVNGRSVDYSYGQYELPIFDSYEIGDIVSYNNIEYYVIEESSPNEANVTLLKKTPLTVAEVNQYGGVGTEYNHVNMYNTSSSDSYYQTAYNKNGSGGMAYYSSINCGYGEDSNHTVSGCITDYTQSEIKYVVDAWAVDNVPSGLQSARLITIKDLEDNLGYEKDPSSSTQMIPNPTNTPNWVYSNDYWYWTGSQYEGSTSYVWSVHGGGIVGTYLVYNNYNSHVVRPVIVLSKSVISSDGN